MKRPIPNSYWVESGKLLAGEYPGGDGEAATRRRLKLLHEAGIRHFFDLTEPGELQPYQPLLPADAFYRNFPIPDHSIPRSGQSMQEILAALAAAHAGDGGIYVHCRAGIGRTGMTIGCWLREQGADADAALEELNRLWQQNARAALWPSVPETDAQYLYVQRWQGGRAGAAAAGVRAEADSGLLRLDRYRGCLLGLALGDALAGADPQDRDAPLRWGDDTAMTLCAAGSLLARDGFDGRDQVERYLRWQRDPAASGADPAAVLRPSVRNALLRALRSHARFHGSLDPSVVDAAPLARSAAAALFAAAEDGAATGLASALAADMARVTHQAPLVVDCCRLFAAMLGRALEGHDKPAVIAAAAAPAGLPLKDEVLQMAAGWAAPPGGRRPGLPAILAVLDRATRSFARADTVAGFERLRDTPGVEPDATLAAYGALAGAWQGAAGLPAALLARLQGREQIEALAGELHARVRAGGGTRASGAKVP